MRSAEPGSVSSVLPARQAREVLSSALCFVQLVDSTSPLLPGTIGELAAASSALYRVESEALTDEAGVSLVCSAIDRLTRALAHLQKAKLHDRALEVPAQSVARTLAMLYPISQTAARRRREVMPEGALSASEIEELRGTKAPRAQPKGERFSGHERRRQPEPRSVFEVEIGLASESNFYAGLTSDVSSGGLFVSTHQPAVPGATVTLYFVLPDGHPVEAAGVVRWTREASADAGPGMGVAFAQLKPEDSAAIARYCSNRAPLFHENE